MQLQHLLLHVDQEMYICELTDLHQLVDTVHFQQHKMNQKHDKNLKCKNSWPVQKEGSID
jgi:hypothetical protein